MSDLPLLPKELRPVFARAQHAVNEGLSVLLVGVPGAGKTMVARRLRRPLRDVTDILHRDLIWRLSGVGEAPSPLEGPFRAPHHTCSKVGLIGGNNRPGEVSLAHGGILFLDEAPEFSRQCLEAVAVAYREKWVEFSPRSLIRKLPCDFALVGASNPCSCGYWGYSDRRFCQCDEPSRKRYLSRLVPMRFDVVIHMFKE